MEREAINWPLIKRRPGWGVGAGELLREDPAEGGVTGAIYQQPSEVDSINKR